MPDLREVFEMVKQQTEPDLDSWAEQERRMRNAQRKQKVGAFALVAMFAIAATVFVLNNRTDDEVVPGVQSESVDPSPDGAGDTPIFGFAQYDLATGTTTGLGIRASGFAEDVSLDGTKITYADSSTGDVETVHVANVDGSNIQEFERTDLAGQAMGPRWSSDGTKIVFQGKPASAQIGNLYVLDVTTGNVEQITDLEPMTAGVWWMGPTFSADGQTVFYNKARIPGLGNRDIGQRWDVWSVPASGGEPTLVRKDAFGVDVSPTGDAIAFNEVLDSDNGFQLGDVYVARPDGSGARKVADAPAEFARWSPDGSQLAWAQHDSAYVMDVESGAIQQHAGATGWSDWIDADTLMIEVG